MKENNNWVPVSERLPGRFETVLLSVKDTNSGNKIVETGTYNYTTEEWEIDAQMPDHRLCKGEIVEAWQPLPEPWRGEE